MSELFLMLLMCSIKVLKSYQIKNEYVPLDETSLQQQAGSIC